MALTYVTVNYSLQNCHAIINWTRGTYLWAGYSETGSRLDQYRWH